MRASSPACRTRWRDRRDARAGRRAALARRSSRSVGIAAPSGHAARRREQRQLIGKRAGIAGRARAPSRRPPSGQLSSQAAPRPAPRSPPAGRGPARACASVAGGSRQGRIEFVLEAEQGDRTCSRGAAASEGLQACRPGRRASVPARIGCVRQRGEARPQRQQVAGEVAAVDRGHVHRQQRLQRLRVVPVVEVAAVALEPVHRGERIARALQAAARPARSRSRSADRLASSASPMLVGEVRCASTGAGCSWKLSGGSQWSAGPTKVSKKRPGPARDQAQERALLRREPGLRARERPAEPPGEHRRRRTTASRIGAAAAQRAGAGIEQQQRRADRERTARSTSRRSDAGRP